MSKIRNICVLLVLTVIMFMHNPSVKAYDINKETTDIHKTWNIQFNQDVNFDEETKTNIILTDSKGNIIKTTLSCNGKIITVDAPKEGYKEGETYTVNIKNKVHSIKSKYLKEDIKFNFKVNNSGNLPTDDKYKEKVDNSINFGINKIVNVDGVQDEWQAILIAKNGQTVPDNYMKSLDAKIKSSNGILAQPTEYEKTVLTLVAAGKDPLSFQGYNLVEKIYNNNDIPNQGINAYIFGLIALDSGKFNVPNDAIWTRDKLIQTILDSRTSDKGWDYAGYKADPDMTGMALTALSPYRDRQDVKSAIEEAVNVLSSIQNENGGFSSWDTANSESSSQVIIGLCSNKIDPTSNKFVKNGKNPLDALLEFEVKDGGFCHTKETGYNTMATEQAVQALEAYKMFKAGTGNIYN